MQVVNVFTVHAVAYAVENTFSFSVILSPWLQNDRIKFNGWHFFNSLELAKVWWKKYNQQKISQIIPKKKKKNIPSKFLWECEFNDQSFTFIICI